MAIEMEGLREFNQAVRKAVDTDLGKRIGQANKKIGQLVIDRLSPSPDPRAVGAGRGATVRPSASKREVSLRVGGTHRQAMHGPPSPGRPPLDEVIKMSPWGATRVVRPGSKVPKRPFIAKTVENNSYAITDAYMDAITEALRPAFTGSTR